VNPARLARRTLAATGCVTIGTLSAACHGSSAVGETASLAASAAAVRAPPPVPADQLAPGELLEGTDKALDVTLPRGLHVDGRFADLVLTSGPLGVHPLVAYFQAHVQGGDLREGSTTATFDHVTAHDHPDRPLSVRILKAGDGVHVDIRDVTPPKLPDLPDEAARWKQVGLTPSGRLLDPTHLD
jgi:hypothetical protein